VIVTASFLHKLTASWLSVPLGHHRTAVSAIPETVVTSSSGRGDQQGHLWLFPGESAEKSGQRQGYTLRVVEEVVLMMNSAPKIVCFLYFTFKLDVYFRSAFV